MAATDTHTAPIDTTQESPSCMSRLRRETTEFLETAPWKFFSSIELDASPDTCFAILLDDRSFQYWHPEITNIRWLVTDDLPSPKQSGSQRLMQYSDWLCYALLGGPVTIQEDYVVVDSTARQIQICFASIGRPSFMMFHAFYEEYQVETLQGTPNKCRLIRRIGVEPAFLTRRVLGCITYPTMRKTLEDKCALRLKTAIEDKILPVP